MTRPANLRVWCDLVAQTAEDVKKYDQGQSQDPPPPAAPPPSDSVVVVDTQVVPKPGDVAGVEIQGHPLDEYNGLYLKDRFNNERPVFKHEERSRYLYFCEAETNWFLHEQFKPKKSLCASWTDWQGMLPPIGEAEWTHYIGRKWRKRSLTLTALTAGQLKRPGPAGQSSDDCLDKCMDCNCDCGSAATSGVCFGIVWCSIIIGLILKYAVFNDNSPPPPPCAGVRVTVLGACPGDMGGCYERQEDQENDKPHYVNSDEYHLYHHTHGLGSNAQGRWRFDTSQGPKCDLAPCDLAHMVSDTDSPPTTGSWTDHCTGDWDTPTTSRVTVSEDEAPGPCSGLRVSGIGSRCDSRVEGCYTLAADQENARPHYLNTDGYNLHSYMHGPQYRWGIHKADATQTDGVWPDPVAFIAPSVALTPPEEGWKEKCSIQRGARFVDSGLRISAPPPPADDGAGAFMGGRGGSAASPTPEPSPESAGVDASAGETSGACTGVVVSSVGSGCGPEINGCYALQEETENSRPVYVNAAGSGYVLHCVLHGQQWRWVIEVGRVGETGERMVTIAVPGSTRWSDPNWALIPPMGSPSRQWSEKCSGGAWSENSQLRVTQSTAG